MNERDDRGGGRDGREDGDEPGGPGNAASQRSRARALAVSTALVVFLFLVHILVLFLVEPLKILRLSRLNAYAMSIIPLGMGLAFFVDAITSFVRLETRSTRHFAIFLLAALFGSLSIHGLLGFFLFVIRHPPAF